MLYSDPLKNHMRNHEFRTRDTSKEIQPKMRFTAKTGIERVFDQIRQSANYVESHSKSKKWKSKTKKKKNKNNSREEGDSFNSTEVAESEKSYESKILRDLDGPNANMLAKSLRPDLHLKTHFQAVSSMYNGQSKVLKSVGNKKGKLHMEMEEVMERIMEHKIGLEKGCLGMLNRRKSMYEQPQGLSQGSNLPRKFAEASQNELVLPSLGVDSTNPLKKNASELRPSYNPEIYNYLTKFAPNEKLSKRDTFKNMTHAKSLERNQRRAQPIGGDAKRRAGLLRFDALDAETITGMGKNTGKNVDTEQVAGEVLLLCNMYKKRNENSPLMLKKGEGHLMSGFGNNNKYLEGMSIGSIRESTDTGILLGHSGHLGHSGKLGHSGHRRNMSDGFSTTTHQFMTGRRPLDRMFGANTISPTQKVVSFLDKSHSTSKFRMAGRSISRNLKFDGAKTISRFNPNP